MNCCCCGGACENKLRISALLFFPGSLVDDGACCVACGCDAGAAATGCADSKSPKISSAPLEKERF